MKKEDLNTDMPKFTGPNALNNFLSYMHDRIRSFEKEHGIESWEAEQRKLIEEGLPPYEAYSKPIFFHKHQSYYTNYFNDTHRQLYENLHKVLDSLTRYLR